MSFFPAVACLALALVATVPPGRAGADRLARLKDRVPVGRPPRLPAAVMIVIGIVVGFLALGPAGAVAGGGAVVGWRHRRDRRRVAEATTAAATELAAALGRIIEELRAGAHPAATLRGTGADGPLARAVLEPAAAATALGEGVPAALADAAIRNPGVADDLRRIARTWALADRHGVAVAELLASVLADLRWRVGHAARVRAQLAGPRATATVLTALPGLGIALGELVGAGPLAVLRSGMGGQALVVVGGGLAAGGAAWTAHILRGAVR